MALIEVVALYCKNPYPSAVILGGCYNSVINGYMLFIIFIAHRMKLKRS